MTNIIDVARRAGVSISTVSRVMSGQAVVAAKTREKVLRAISELDFRPNHMAQGLRLGRTRTVALAIGDIEQHIYLHLFRHVQSALEEAGLDLLLFNLGHRGERFEAVLSRAETLKLSGLLFATSDILDVGKILEFRERVATSDCPVIMLGQNLSEQGICSVWHDDVGASYRATKHLIGLGCRNIAFVGRITGSVVGQSRLAGYSQALRESLGEVAPERVWDAAYRYPAGYAAMEKALNAGVPVDAVFAASDEMALGVMAAAMDRGLGIPEQVSVIGFDNIEWGQHVRPALSTLSRDLPQVAAKVKQLIEDAHAGRPLTESVRIERELILRGSVKTKARRARSTGTGKGEGKR